MINLKKLQSFVNQDVYLQLYGGELINAIGFILEYITIETRTLGVS